MQKVGCCKIEFCNSPKNSATRVFAEEILAAIYAPVDANRLHVNYIGKVTCVLQFSGIWGIGLAVFRVISASPIMERTTTSNSSVKLRDTA